MANLLELSGAGFHELRVGAIVLVVGACRKVFCPIIIVQCFLSMLCVRGAQKEQRKRCKVGVS